FLSMMKNNFCDIFFQFIQ
ncbi:Protein SprT, partial [Haemophilus influenzae]